MTEQLKRCPFCGGSPELDIQRPYNPIHGGLAGKQVAIYCRDCPADMSLCYEDSPWASPEQLSLTLIAQWNRRPELMTEEERFEEWAEDETELDLHKFDGEHFTDYATFYAWSAWQAALASRESRKAEHTEHCLKRQQWGDGECECASREDENAIIKT